MEYIYNLRLLIDSLFNIALGIWIRLGLDPVFFGFIKRFVIGGIFLSCIAVTVMFLVWLERRLSGRFQSRIGPNRVGWQGALQPLADVVKLIAKENIVPKNADHIVHLLAPVVVFAPAFMAFVCLPFAPGLIIQDLNIGIFYILSITSVGVLGILMAGWGSNNKYSLLGGMRAAAQIVSYEIPLVLSIIGVIMMTGTLRLPGIVDAQKNIFDWFVFRQPLAFIIYIIAATAELNRVPFDIPEAESELTGGFHTEYTGIKFGIFFLAEFTNMFMVAGIAACLFLGGWQGFGFLPPYVWFLLKVYMVVFLLIWFRWTFPRLRVDQLMNLGWKILTPLAFANILFTGLRILR